MGGERYPAEIREQAIALYIEEEISAAKVAAQLGLRAYTVKEWVSAAGVMRSMQEAASLSIARNPRGHRGIKIRWVSAKSGRVEFADSTYEAARMDQLDRDPAVAFWERCGDRIPYRSEAGSVRMYVPDLSVQLIDGSRRVEEIKPAAFIERFENPRKFAAARDHYTPQEVEFRVITERELGDRGRFPEYRKDAEAAAFRHGQKVKERRKVRTAAETPEQRRDRLDREAAKARRYRQRRAVERPETSAEAEIRRARQREYSARYFANEDPEKRRFRLDAAAERERNARHLKKLTESSEDIQRRRTSQQARDAKRFAAETPEKRRARLDLKAERARAARSR